MRFVLALVILLAVLVPMSSHAAAEPAGARVLLVVSGNGRDEGRSSPGFEYDEFAQSWVVLRDNGVIVEVASPQGGPVEVDAFEHDKPYNARALADPAAQAALQATLATGAVDPTRYAGVFVLGGGGAMFDLYRDPGLTRLLEEVHAAGGVIGAVCHGPVVLAALRDAAGRPLVAGRRITGFTNAEERLFGARWSKTYPVLLEDALKETGADFAEGAPMLPHVVSEARIVTGQNPFSTSLAIEAMLRAMGREPAARTAWQDEASLLLVQRHLQGDSPTVRAEIAAAPDGFDLLLIGMWGYYRAVQAGDDTTMLGEAADIMALVADRVAEPRLTLALARSEIRLARSAQARARLEALLARAPDLAPARQMLAGLAE